MTGRPQVVSPITYDEGYAAARRAVMNYPAVAIRMQLDRLLRIAKTDAEWGAADALTDLLGGASR